MKQRLMFGLLAIVILLTMVALPGQALAAEMDPTIIAQEAAESEEDVSNDAVSLLFVMIGLGAVGFVGVIYIASQRSTTSDNTAVETVEE
jgi:hypothetical protein